ncbi:hypothetical protein GQ53DRAFT_815259 [Thozetella sp. PMI_491]|nr:hypothetical protein GQ53DRAFT_815259 [Thozetella sp. PMI_491]
MPKRTHSPGGSDEEGRRPKFATPALGEGTDISGEASLAQEDANIAMETPPAPDAELFQIEISLRSASKADRNDPKPGGYTAQQLDEDGHSEIDDLYEESEPDDISEGSSADEFAEWSWLEQIDGIATSDGKKIAVCDAKLIRRRKIAPSFWAEMGVPTRETSDLAFELFDRWGRLDSKYYMPGFKRGTGVWGSELNSGDILLFERIDIVSEMRRRRLATRIVTAVLDKVRLKSTHFFALTKPGYLEAGMSATYEDDRSEHIAIAEQFWRSLGFRRVGTSDWFAFSDCPDHPSWQLQPSEDWSQPKMLEHQEPIPDTILMALLNLASPDMSNRDCLHLVQDAMPADVEDKRWLITDNGGSTILHLAAISSRLEVVEYVFSHRPDLALMRNLEGETPLDALREILESLRTTTGIFGMNKLASDSFTGFKQCTIACVGVLSGVPTFDLDTLSPIETAAASSCTEEQAHHIPNIESIRHALRLKYGCTCGECTGGFLSPRMTFALVCQAEQHYELLSRDQHLSGNDWVWDHATKCILLPLSVIQNMETNQEMRRGFTNIFGHIASCLKQKKIPSEANVRAMLEHKSFKCPLTTKIYFHRGGTVGAAAATLFEEAMAQDKCSGNGYHQRFFADQVEQLPECRNDHEYRFVSGMCGYERA